MCFFKKWREKRKKKKKDKMLKAKTQHEVVGNEEKMGEGPQSEELNAPIKPTKTDAPKSQPEASEETVEKLKIRPFAKPKVSHSEENGWPKKEVIVEDDTPEEKTTKKASPKKSKKTQHKKYEGKYEIYPESDFYKFRLKASNGEILAVSFRYSSESGAQTGIKTFKKNVEEGQFNIITDKNNFSQFFLYNSTGARIIIVGELYQSVQKANSAVESVKSFYQTDKIDVLDEIPKSEIREEAINFDSVEESDMGKYELFEDNGLYYLRLRASNSQILFVSQGYASKASAKSGLKTIQKAIKDRNFTVSRDKQNRYQFNLYSSNGQIILAGETYSAKSKGISAAHSVLKFGLKAAIVEV